MKRNIFKLFYVVIMVFSVVSAHSVRAQDSTPPNRFTCSVNDARLQSSNKGWVETDRSDGIINFSQSVDGSDQKAYKGTCTINCPLELIYSILTNIPEHTKWIKYCADSREIERPSVNRSVQYYDFDVPWPLLNRDIVVNCVTEEDWEEGKVVITSEAVQEPLVPIRENHLRITDSTQKWILEQAGPDATRVTLISFTRLEGSISGMLNRLVSQTVPSDSLKNLKDISVEKYLDLSSRLLAEYPRPNSDDL